jgi:hypothetical protein
LSIPHESDTPGFEEESEIEGDMMPEKMELFQEKTPKLMKNIELPDEPVPEKHEKELPLEKAPKQPKK